MKIIDSNNDKWDISLQNINNLNLVRKISLNDENFDIPKTEYSINKKIIDVALIEKSQFDHYKISSKIKI